jgi:hypothetical protein
MILYCICCSLLAYSHDSQRRNCDVSHNKIVICRKRCNSFFDCTETMNKICCCVKLQVVSYEYKNDRHRKRLHDVRSISRCPSSVCPTHFFEQPPFRDITFVSVHTIFTFHHKCSFLVLNTCL